MVRVLLFSFQLIFWAPKVFWLLKTPLALLSLLQVLGNAFGATEMVYQLKDYTVLLVDQSLFSSPRESESQALITPTSGALKSLSFAGMHTYSLKNVCGR